MVLGAIAGDIIGSVYEFENTKDEDFELFGERSGFTHGIFQPLGITQTDG